MSLSAASAPDPHPLPTALLATLDHLGEGLLVVSPRGEVVYVNALGAECFRLSPGELQNRCLWQVLPQLAQDFPIFTRTYRRALADRFPLEIAETQLYSLQTLHIRFVPTAEALLIYCRDITIQRQTQLELQCYMAREHLFVALDQRICQSLDLEEVLMTTVEEVRSFLDADRALIYQYQADSRPREPDRSPLETFAPHPDRPNPNHGETVTTVLVAQSCAPGWKLPQDQTVRDPTIASDPDPVPTHDTLPPSSSLPPTAQACLTVPIFQDDQRWGCLMVQQCAYCREWQVVEIQVLEGLAMRLVVAIRQAELYQRVQHLNVALEQKVQERTAQLEQAIAWEAMLKRITDRVRDSLDESQILQQAVRELATALNVGSCNAALYNLEQGTSTIYYEFVTTLPASQGRVAKMTDYPELYKQLLQGRYFQFCSITPNPVRGHAAMLACPIFDNCGILGDLWLVNQAEHSFSEVEIRFAQQVANQCAIALRQAKLYQEAQAQVAKLEELNHLKDDFLSTVSHELRTPMTNLKMAIKMLGLAAQEQQRAIAEVLPEPNAQLVHLHQRMGNYLSILGQECEREIQLINDLLDLQRLEANAQPVTPQPLDLPTWLPEQVHGFYDRAREHQQTLQVNLTPDLPLLYTDHPSLGRVVAELLNNACKYTPPGETIALQATVLPSQSFQLQVTNTGVEISPTEQRRIFNKFYRIASNDPWRQGGTGLGLALVQQLAQRLGGQITVDSGTGWTRFQLTIPVTLTP